MKLNEIINAKGEYPEIDKWIPLSIEKAAQLISKEIPQAMSNKKKYVKFAQDEIDLSTFNQMNAHLFHDLIQSLGYTLAYSNIRRPWSSVNIPVITISW